MLSECQNHRHATGLKAGLKWWAPGLTIVAVLAPAPAAAETVVSAGIEAVGRQVDDEALATMRGKFVMPNDIAFFGVQMLSSWQGSDGITTSAILSFSVSFAGGAGSGAGAVPQLLISFDRECGGCSDSAMDVDGFSGAATGGYVAIAGATTNLPIGGLGSVNGAVQTQQIAGSDNQVSNAMSIAIVPVSAVVENAAGLDPATSGSTHIFSDGDSLQFILNGNQVGIALNDGNGADSVVQSVNGATNQAAQHVLLSTSNNVVDNQMRIVIGLDNLSQQTSRISVQNAISTMKGHGF